MDADAPSGTELFSREIVGALDFGRPGSLALLGAGSGGNGASPPPTTAAVFVLSLLAG
jgi:hypothetical protein